MLKIIKKGLVAGLVSLSFLESCSYCKMISIKSAESRMPVIEKNINLNDTIDYEQMTSNEVISFVKTPNQVQDYLDRHLIYDLSSVYKSFNETHINKKALCIGYAFSAASLLIDDGYPPIILGLKNKKQNHLMYLYNTEKGFSVLGNNATQKRYLHIGELLKDFENNYNNIYPKKYFIIDLNDNSPNKEWMNSNKILNKRVGFWNYKKIIKIR